MLALLGENGAGKTTLMSILFGHYVADDGESWSRTRRHARCRSAPVPPQAALAAGIGMVHQHFTLADNLTVLDNMVLGTEPLWQLRLGRAAARAAKLDRDRAERSASRSIPRRAVARLSVGERQRVEILKALYRDARVLILDEPTAVLTPQEAEALFATLAGWSRPGPVVIFISHKLDEVLRRRRPRRGAARRRRSRDARPRARTARRWPTLMVGRDVAGRAAATPRDAGGRRCSI